MLSSIPRDCRVLSGKQLLAIITGRTLVYNIVNHNSSYINPIQYFDDYPQVMLTSSSQIQLSNIVRYRNGIVYVPLEHIAEHWSLLILNIDKKIFWVVDPVHGTDEYTFMDKYVVPSLLLVLKGWTYRKFSSAILGPMYKTSDDMCYMYVILLIFLLDKQYTIVDIFTQLDGLDAYQLKDMLSQFISWVYHNVHGNVFLQLNHILSKDVQFITYQSVVDQVSYNIFNDYPPDVEKCVEHYQSLTDYVRREL